MKKNKKPSVKNTREPYRFPTVYPGMPIEPLQSVKTDPLGSYTGTPVDGGVPVQDADDL